MLFLYIDDWLIVSQSESTLQQHIGATLSLLNKLGLQVNIPKLNLHPSYHPQFISAIIDTIVCRAFLPSEKAQTLCGTALQLKSDGACDSQIHTAAARAYGSDYSSPHIHRLWMRLYRSGFLTISNHTDNCSQHT